MPPRHAYWTILIDDKATAFRAREREELQPTLVQLQRKNANVTMRWFARGKLWETREAERDDFQSLKQAPPPPRERSRDDRDDTQRRGADWRPGGTHKDPRDRFKKKNRPERAWSEKDPATQRDRDKPGYVAARPRGDRPWQDKSRGDRPWTGKPDEPRRGPTDQRASEGSARPNKPGWRDKPVGAQRSDRPRQNYPTGDGRSNNKPSGAGHRPWTGQPRERKPWTDKSAAPNDRPWQTKPTGPRAQRKPWVGKPSADGPRGDRPRSDTSGGGPPRGNRPWNAQSPAGEKRPWTGKPSGPPKGDRPRSNIPGGGLPRSNRPWNPQSSTGEKRPWAGKPSGPPRGDQPWNRKPAGGGGFKPWAKKPTGPGGPAKPDVGGRHAGPRKRRDDEPDGE